VPVIPARPQRAADRELRQIRQARRSGEGCLYRASHRGTLVPGEGAISFGPEEAVVCAELYKAVRRPRGREIDLAIAAPAILREAQFWTLNQADFRDVPGLRLFGKK